MLCYAYCISPASQEWRILHKSWAETTKPSVCCGIFSLKGSFRPLNVLCLAKLPRTGCPQGVRFIDLQICLLFFLHHWSQSAEHQHLDSQQFENVSTDGCLLRMWRYRSTGMSACDFNDPKKKGGKPKNSCALCFQIIFSLQLFHHEVTILTLATRCVFFIITPLLSCCTVNDTDCVLTLIGVSRGWRHAPAGDAINEWVTTVTLQSWTKLKLWSGDEDNLTNDLQQKKTILKKGNFG